MRYALATWEVRDLLLIPSFMFSESAVIKRLVALKPDVKAESRFRPPSAAPVGWAATWTCTASRPRPGFKLLKPFFHGDTDILSVNSKHRPEACATVITPPEEVREKFERVKPLGQIKAKERGWTLDVLNAIRRLGKPDFTNDDVYAHDRELEELHPDNPVNNRVTRGRPPRPGHLSRFGDGERNLAESKGPRGPSERARASPNPPATSGVA